MKSKNNKRRKQKSRGGYPNLRLVKDPESGAGSTGRRRTIGFRNRKETDTTSISAEVLSERSGRKKRRITIFLILFLVCGLAAAGGGYYILTEYKVKEVHVDGLVHYTKEEIMDMVMDGYLGDNSLYLTFKYRNKGVDDIPFIEKMDVEILSPDSIRIMVYEKALAGYVEYLGKYMYFDKDGIVTECSEMRTEGIPQVTGLDFSYVVLYEPLPVPDQEVFKKILNVTQLLIKYDLAADKIFFDSDYHVTLYFDHVKVLLGDSSSIDRKIMKLQSILSNLKGQNGTLSMENYTEDSRNITFRGENAEMEKAEEKAEEIAEEIE